MESNRAWALPLVIGGGALAVGLFVGLRAPSPQQPPAAAQAAGAAPVADAPTGAPEGSDVNAVDEPAQDPAQDPAAVAAAPDLDGPDVGTLVLSEAKDVTSLAVVGERLVWLTTERGRLRSAARIGGPITELTRGGDADDFGGALVAGAGGVYWTLERHGGDNAPIFFLAADATEAMARRLEPLARGTSPSNLLPTADTLSWSDLGALWELRPGATARRRTIRDRRIATAASCGDTLHWIEVPYEGTPTASLMRLPPDADEPQPVVAVLPAGEPDLLRCDDGQLHWALDGAPKRRGLYRAPSGGDEAERLLATGQVVALEIWRGELIWVEAHGSDEEPVALLQQLRPGDEARRLGRDSGRVRALASDESAIYWATDAGIKRLALQAPASP